MRLDYLRIKSSWFGTVKEVTDILVADGDEGIPKGKHNKLKRIGAKGFRLYIAMMNDRRHNMDYDVHEFKTDLYDLKRSTGYSYDEIVELLKALKREGILEFERLSRWDSLKKDNGRWNEDYMIRAKAIDAPQVKRVKQNNKEYDEKCVPVDMLRDIYTTLDLRMIEHLEAQGFNENGIITYVALRKFYSYEKGYAYPAIDTICEVTGLNNRTVIEIVHTMNEKRILRIDAENNGKRALRYNYALCIAADEIEKFQTEESEKRSKSDELTAMYRNPDGKPKRKQKLKKRMSNADKILKFPINESNVLKMLIAK